ncbi:hypothetical protein KC19_1G073500 [Ceratodon purpureus]|uniref:Uncharacterized protein n=1 Tax=Ceratodon purpureus TaxID=3225 RepID=A0A8T0J2J1_CERPU|nr:hypothetical protein KC19_1G073500 [Ceratodon purpureus]
MLDGVNDRRSSNDRKRSSSSSDGHGFDGKRRTVDGPGKSHSGYGGVHTPSYPVSSLYHSPSHADAEVSNGSHSIHSRRPSSGNCTGPVQSSRRDMMERSGYPAYELTPREEGYPGQYDLRDSPYGQPLGDMGRPCFEMEIPPMPSYSPPRTKQNRFNLSRYQLDENDDLLASTPASEPEEKPNRFKTQRERLMLAVRAERSQDVSGSTAPSVDETSLCFGDADSSSQSQSQSQDSYMSQRERLRRFSSEQSRHVVIPNEWEGETKLQEFVAFGNIEAALRPLGLMMARAALVSDSVNTRHHQRSVSSGPSGCHTTLSNPLTS